MSSYKLINMKHLHLKMYLSHCREVEIGDAVRVPMEGNPNLLMLLTDSFSFSFHLCSNIYNLININFVNLNMFGKIKITLNTQKIIKNTNYKNI